MRRYTLGALLVTTFCLPTALPAADSFSGTPVPYQGAYILYSGDLGDWAAPPAAGAKLDLEITGDAAKKIYAQLGAKAQHSECVEPGDKMRSKGDIDCIQYADGTAACHVGIDLRSGKSIPGSIC